MMRPFERVTGRLEYVRKSGGGSVVARCPAHRDKSPSLSVKEGGDGRVLLYCFAGCPTSDVVAALKERGDADLRAGLSTHRHARAVDAG